MKKDLQKPFNAVQGRETAWLLKEKYHHKPTEKFHEDVKKIKAGEPVDYVIGFTEFLNCKIDLSQKTLIPRQDTAFWVAEAIKEIKKSKNKSIKILDIFSGSGCIGLAVLKNVLPARRSLGEVGCDFADKDKKAVEQIKINCKLNQPSRKASAWQSKIIQSDVFKKVRGKYDFIFANPPYVAVKKIYSIQKSVLKYEPKNALFGGSDGLYYIKIFLAGAKKHLNPGGKIFMEFSPEQKPAIEKIIQKNKYSNYEFRRDEHRWRWVIVS